MQTRFCSRCGTPVVGGQRFCRRCGLATTGPIVERAHEHTSQLPRQGYQPIAPRTPSPQQEQKQQIPYAPSPLATKRTRSFNRFGCVLILLVLLLLLGGVSYFGIAVLGWHLPGIGGAGPTQPPVTTIAINSTLPYAGAIVTVLNAQQAKSFVDDPQTSSTGMVRLHLQEQNKTSISISWNYRDVARLLLPSGTTILSTYVNASVSLSPGASQTSIVDFTVSSSVAINKLSLRLGKTQEVQMDILLTGKADLNQYQPKVFTLNGQMQYMGLNWTLVSATTQLSMPGQQASTGMQYIIITLKVDNPLSQTTIVGSPYDYVRLQFNNTTASPTNTTLPVSFEKGTTGKMGTVTFLVPQNTTAFTLILLAQSQSGADQATTDFQLQ